MIVLLEWFHDNSTQQLAIELLSDPSNGFRGLDEQDVQMYTL